MLAQRVASAALGIPLIVLVAWAGGPWYTGVACLIVLIAAYEFQSAQRRRWTPLALVAAGLAAGRPLVDAAAAAIDFVARALASAPGLGAGRGPINHFVEAHPGPPDDSG